MVFRVLSKYSQLTRKACYSPFLWTLRNISGNPFIRTVPYIGGKFDAKSLDSKQTFPVHNPATGEKLADVVDCGVKDVDRAIDLSYEAFQSWRFTTGRERAHILRKMFEILTKHNEKFAELITAENGKPMKDAKNEVTYAANFLEWFSEEARRVYGDIIDAPLPSRKLLVLRQPLGVTGMITPWNFPLAMATRKLGACLAAGCTAVLKPAHETPLSALALGQVAAEVGLPASVFQVVTCAGGESVKRVGERLCTSEKVRKITFTGSTAVGKVLLSQGANTVKKMSLELGGNAPFIVFPSADIQAAVKGAIDSKFRGSGQTCVCSNRILVHKDVFDDFSRALAEAVRRDLKVGNGMHEGVNQGPLISRSAVEKVQRLVSDAVANGAKVLVGGKRGEGLFFEPTVLADVKPDMACFREEIFGPVAPLVKFSTEEEAIALANSVRVGLAGYFYSRDLSQIWRVAERLEVGMVGVNEGLISTVEAPFGGIKESGMGREGSKYGVLEYTELKYVCLGGLQ